MTALSRLMLAAMAAYIVTPRRLTSTYPDNH
jgi:hypothetical protein